MPESERIDVVSDIICPWCYIGKRQLERALQSIATAELMFSVQWHPFQLLPEMPSAGRDRRAYREAKYGSRARAQEADARVAEAAARVGLEFRFDLMQRIPNTLAAHRVVWLAGREGKQDAVVEALFRAHFLQGRDVGDGATLVDVAGDAGLDPAKIAALLAGREGRAEVLAEEQKLRRAGVAGVPAFLIGNRVVIAGAAPVEAMAEAFITATHTAIRL
jgi:predicted DsbA family dithiol-disulfide isomerase